MIFSTYQGIGKSTLAKKDFRIIDLESSCYDKANPNWFKDYVNTAINLYKQGYTVFISSHKVVRDYLLQHIENKNDYAMIMYDINLEVYCLDKPAERFEKSCEEYGQDSQIAQKNFRAYQNAGGYFEASYNEIKEDEKNGLNVIWITDSDYDLNNLITSAESNKENNIANNETISGAAVVDTVDDADFLDWVSECID